MHQQMLLNLPLKTMGQETSSLTELFIRWAGSRRQMSLTIPLNPVPASRPRVTKWGVHYLKTYATWKKQAILELPEGTIAPFGGKPLAVYSEFVVKKAKTTKRHWPIGDNDNYEKATWDAITQCESVWKDDDQIVWNLSHKRYITEGEQPHCDVLVVLL
jgi:Holliday junction resolvase RusA-like endonuclease